MEHDTSLWTSPYNDTKYGKELGASWKYFQEFIKMDSPRTLVGFHEHLANILTNNGRKRIPSYEKIREYSAKWKWMMRSKAYDEYMQHKHDEELAEKIKRIREDRIDAQKLRMEYQDKLFRQLMNDDSMETNQKVYGASKNSEAIRNETASFNEIVNEGRTKLDANVDADVKQEIEQENKTTMTIFDIVDKELELEENAIGEKGHSSNKEG